MLNKVLKIITSILLSIIIAFGVYVYLIIILTPKDIYDEDGRFYYTCVNFNVMPKNTIDLAIFGNSDAYCGFSPMEFYEQTGATSYVRAGPKESVVSMKDNLKETLASQDLQLAIIDTDCFFWDNTLATGSYKSKHVLFQAPIYYHSRWKKLTLADFFTLPTPRRDVLKGYWATDSVVDCSHFEGYMEKTSEEPYPLPDSVLKDFDDIVQICKNNNVEILLICTPSPISWNYRKNLTISNLAQKYDLPFLDFNLPREDYADYTFDMHTFFKDDGDHYNTVGATYNTQYLANYISNHYTLTNHKEDPDYQAWNDDLVKYYEAIKFEVN